MAINTLTISALWMLIVWVVTPFGLSGRKRCFGEAYNLWAPKMQTCFCETLICKCKSKRRFNPNYQHQHLNRCQNLKPLYDLLSQITSGNSLLILTGEWFYSYFIPRPFFLFYILRLSIFFSILPCFFLISPVSVFSTPTLEVLLKAG